MLYCHGIRDADARSQRCLFCRAVKGYAVLRIQGAERLDKICRRWQNEDRLG